MSSSNIVIEVAKMKDLYSGLGQFCKNLSNAILKKNTSVTLYHGKKEHRFFPYLLPEAAVWHGTHQDTPFIPSKGKFVLTIHDFNQLYKEKANWRHSLYRRKIQKKINRASHIVFISKFVQSEAIKLFDLGNTPHSVIYNGVELSSDFKTPKHIPSNPFLFTISAIMEKKNLHVLLPMMKESTDDLSLVIAGKSNTKYAESLKRSIQELGLENKVELVGAVSEEEKYWYMQNCKGFVFPSLMEGFGIPVAEAMQMGKPVFLSDRTSLPEIAGEFGHYWNTFVPLEMLKVLNEGLQNFTEKKSEQMKIFASRYNWDEAAAAYIKIYKGLLP